MYKKLSRIENLIQFNVSYIELYLLIYQGAKENKVSPR